MGKMEEAEEVSEPEGIVADDARSDKSEPPEDKKSGEWEPPEDKQSGESEPPEDKQPGESEPPEDKQSGESQPPEDKQSGEQTTAQGDESLPTDAEAADDTAKTDHPATHSSSLSATISTPKPDVETSLTDTTPATTDGEPAGSAEKAADAESLSGAPTERIRETHVTDSANGAVSIIDDPAEDEAGSVEQVTESGRPSQDEFGISKSEGEVTEETAVSTQPSSSAEGQVAAIEKAAVEPKDEDAQAEKSSSSNGEQVPSPEKGSSSAQVMVVGSTNVETSSAEMEASNSDEGPTGEAPSSAKDMIDEMKIEDDGAATPKSPSTSSRKRTSSISLSALPQSGSKTANAALEQNTASSSVSKPANKKPSGTSLRSVQNSQPDHSSSVPSMDDPRPIISPSHEPRVDCSSLTERLYRRQIQSGHHDQLSATVVEADGSRRQVQPGAVHVCHTVNISLAGARALSSEPYGPGRRRRRRRGGPHDCLMDGVRTSRPPASADHGQYPDYMRINKLNEFVAATIIEKLRLKGLAKQLHEYEGRLLPRRFLADMVLQPRKRQLTDRYYFGYVPPPDRPRYNVAFRRYLQQFQQRHMPSESDVHFPVALEQVRHLARRPGNQVELAHTLAEVVRAQEEPGFGTRQGRRRLSAAA